MIASTTRKLATPTNTIVIIDSTRCAWVLKAVVQEGIVRFRSCGRYVTEVAVLKTVRSKSDFCDSEMVA